MTLTVGLNASIQAAQPCLAPATWHVLDAATPRAARAQEVLAEMARRDVVLLGEQHDNFDHHRWQLQTLAALHVLRPRMAIGFESFPRRVQPVLDEWVAGRLTAPQFLARVEWQKVWNFPPELYMPLFQFARVNRIPMIALNVERTLTSTIGEKGWDGVPAEQREGVSRPAAAPPAYEDYLFEVFKQHPRADKKPATRSDTAFRNFVQSQTTWDRAMAEALAARVPKDAPRPLVVGIMGGGHVRHGHGVAHQLRDLGVTSIGTLLPFDADAQCSDVEPKVADAIFALPTSTAEPAPPPRLGVSLESADGAVRIAGVEAGSLAEKSGLQAGDRIVSVAGETASSVTRVISAVRTAPAGTWLPMQVRRGNDTIELVVKFPPKG
jgi:uncharacterized iron-regulated protein